MVKQCTYPEIVFSVAASRMSNDMGLPLADCSRYAPLIDDVFALLLVKFSRETGEKIRVNHGYRPLSYQDHKCPNNGYKWNPKKLPTSGGTILQQCDAWTGGNRNRLAPPGKSPHMCGIAVDVAAGTKLYKMTNAQLKPFGLCKPVPGEPWHVEPILSKRPSGYDRYRLAVSLSMPFVWGITRHGDIGVTVCQVQIALVKAGFNLSKIDGVFGDNTETAIKAFQKAKGLTVDGVAGQNTLKALGLNP